MNINIFKHFIIHKITSWGFNTLNLGQLKCFFIFLLFSLLIPHIPLLNNFLEYVVDFVESMMIPVLGEKTKKFLDFIIILFFLVLLGNLYSLIPHQFPFNSHIIVTFTWALLVFVYGIFQGLKYPKKFISNFIPHDAPWPFIFLITPLKIISFVLSPLSLGLRLFVNSLVGHVMITIFESFGHGPWIAKIPSWIFLMGLTTLELGVSLLQTYIFVMVSINFLKNCTK